MKTVCKSLIIIQAPADIPYALDIIEHEAKNMPHVIVVNVENVYKFLENLNLGVYLSFIPYPKFKHSYYLNLFRIRAYYQSVFRRYIDNNYSTIEKLFFFSRYEDPLSFYLIDRIVKKSPSVEIKYINHYDYFDNDKNQKPSFKQLVFYLSNCFITSLRLKRGWHDKIPEFRISNYCQIAEQKPSLNKGVIKKYSVKYSDKNSALLLFNRTSGGLMDEKVYNASLEVLISTLKANNIVVYSKGHPREGCNDVIKSMSNHLIPDYIPSEFLDVSSFRYVIGLHSTSIAHIARDYNVKTFSMLCCFSCRDVEMMRDYLQKQSEGKILFPHEIEEIF